jgi:hypothetical protein
VTPTLFAWVMFVWSLGLLVSGIELARAAFNRGDRLGALLGMCAFSAGLLTVVLIAPAVMK